MKDIVQVISFKEEIYEFIITCYPEIETQLFYDNDFILNKILDDKYYYAYFFKENR
ncbi:MAG: hypothetical protein J6T10_29520 [Methanobrevibacter sp.]|nr:hypothetical protein [Methanobrevibacter sp.]